MVRFYLRFREKADRIAHGRIWYVKERGVWNGTKVWA